MSEVTEPQEQLLTIPVKKVDVLEREKMRKEAIHQAKFQKELLTEQNKLMEVQNKRAKMIVEEQELSARSWKAWYDKMFYAMECEKIEPSFKEYEERLKAKKAEADAQGSITSPGVTIDNLETVKQDSEEEA